MVDPEKVIRKAKDRILPGFTAKSKWDHSFFFVQAADTQLGMIDTWGDGSVGNKYPNITWDREIELCQQTVDILNRMNPKPAFFIVCGDLVDAFPHEWPQIRASQEEDFFRVFSKLPPDIPLICVCGNHDVGEFDLKAHASGKRVLCLMKSSKFAIFYIYVYENHSALLSLVSKALCENPKLLFPFFISCYFVYMST